MSMIDKFYMLMEEANEIKAMLFKQIGKESVVRDMSTEEFELLKHALKVVDYAMDMSEEQIKAMERIEKKLDKLLEK